MARISTSMRHLVKEIQRSGKARESALRFLSSSLWKNLAAQRVTRLTEAKTFRESVAQGNGDLFRSMRLTLASQRSARLSTARERRAGTHRFLGNIFKNNRHMAADLTLKLFTSETHRRSETLALLQAIAEKRREMASELKASLDQHLQARHTAERSRMVSTGKFVDEVKLVLGDMRGDLTFFFQKVLADREKKVSLEIRQARKIWGDRSRSRTDPAQAGKKGRKLLPTADSLTVSAGGGLM